MKKVSVTKTTENLHQIACKNFKIGDKVKVLFRVPPRAQGWNNVWTPEMDKAIGKILTVVDIDFTSGITLRNKDIYCDFSYPSFCLEKVVEPTQVEVKLNSKYTAIVTKTRIKVGCQTFPVSKIKELTDALNSLTTK